MTLRTAGLIAGVLGLILLAVGGFANMIKPSDSASPTAQVGAAVVVVPPEVIALSPHASLTVSGNGQLAVHTARTQDVAAWTATRTSVTVTGMSDWDTLTATTNEAVTTPSPSPSPSPTASATAQGKTSTSPSSSASATPAPSASPSASPSAVPTGSQDIWRSTEQETNTYTVKTVEVPAGLTLVVESLDGQSIDSAKLTLPRTVDDKWIGQVIWWGVALTIVGLIALIARFIDVRPAQTRGEEWLAQRSGVGAGKQDPKPGSRRHRRSQGAAMPVAEIPGEPPATGSIPIVGEEEPPTDPVPMIALSTPVPAASAFQPPAEEAEADDEEVAADEAAADSDATTDDEGDRS